MTTRKIEKTNHVLRYQEKPLYSAHLFSSGLRLVVVRAESEQPLKIEGNVNEPMVCFGFCLSGEFAAVYGSPKDSFPVKAGHSGVITFPQPLDITDHVAPGPMLRVYLRLEGEWLSTFVQGDEDSFTPILKTLDRKHPSRIIHPTTALVQAILHQILHCPYCGKTGSFYLEGKAMELLSHKLEQLHPSGVCHECRLKSSDRDRVHHAAEVLVNNLVNPPDIATLARSVGFSQSKLYRCFHSVYGASPFEYLRDQRLQTAMLLLQDGEINVTEAAFRVGYTNLSYFAKAFKAMFGVVPGEILHGSASCQSFP